MDLLKRLIGIRSCKNEKTKGEKFFMRQKKPKIVTGDRAEALLQKSMSKIGAYIVDFAQQTARDIRDNVCPRWMSLVMLLVTFPGWLGFLNAFDNTYTLDSNGMDSLAFLSGFLLPVVLGAISLVNLIWSLIVILKGNAEFGYAVGRVLLNLLAPLYIVLILTSHTWIHFYAPPIILLTLTPAALMILTTVWAFLDWDGGFLPALRGFGCTLLGLFSLTLLLNFEGYPRTVIIVCLSLVGVAYIAVLVKAVYLATEDAWLCSITDFVAGAVFMIALIAAGVSFKVFFFPIVAGALYAISIITTIIMTR